MSQVTRCPACATRFKVVADQLRISQGWVRCGVCHEIFDASQDLMPMPVQAAAASAASASSVASAPSSPAVAPSVAAGQMAATPGAGAAPASGAARDPEHKVLPAAPPEELDFDTLMSRFVGEEMDLLAQVQPAQAQTQAPAPAQEPVAQPPAEPRPEAPAAYPPSAADLPASPAPEAVPVPAEQAVPAPAGVAAPEEAAAQAAAQPSPEFSRWPESSGDVSPLPEAEPGFVRQARRQAFWRQPAVRGLLVLGSLGCVAALASQVMWRQRDALAAEHPGLVPTLQALCGMAGCELQPRRQISDVVIGSSGFRQMPRSGQYQWSLSLENRSDLPVAMPAVELTLTDAQDKALLRRVIRLDQLGAPAQIEARGEWSITAPVEVQDLGAVVAGYRALVFYP